MVIYGYSVSMSVIWLMLLAIMLIIEIITLGLTTIWFAGGALVAVVASLLGAPEWLQVVLFLAISLILLLAVRPVARRFLNQNRKQTNLDSLIGLEGRVIETVDNFHSTGKVELRGMEWTARTEEERIIEQGERVEVVSISGVKLIVK